MAKFLIEVPHEGTRTAYMRALRIFNETGSHFLTHADWGCTDGEHKAWMIVEIESKEAAVQILPSAYKARAKITRLSQFFHGDMRDKVIGNHS